MKKRILSFLLALTMVVSLLPVSVLADELETETPEAEAALPEANTPEANTPEEAPEASEQKKDAAPAPELVSEAAPEFAMTLANSASDFEINSGVLTAYNGEGGHVVIPDDVEWIGESVFFGKETLTSVSFPAGLELIGENAFYGCTQLKTVTFKKYPNLDFADYAFSGVGTAESPCSLVLPDGWPDQDKPDQDGSWHGGYFVVVPGEPEEPEEFVIDDFGVLIAYNGAGGDIVIPENVTAIGDGIVSNVFPNKPSITSVTFPAGVKKIGASAFFGCTNLKSITFAVNSQLETISPNAFGSCSQLKSVTFNAYPSVSFAGNAFSFVGTANAPCSLILPKGWGNDKPVAGSTWHGGWFHSVDFVIDADGVLTAYNGDGGEVVIPDGVTAIGANAFSDTAITSVTIPAGVTTIGNRAFENCSKLTSVTFLGCPEEIGNDVFSGVGTPAVHCLLSLPAEWELEKPGALGLWYGGTFKLFGSPDFMIEDGVLIDYSGNSDTVTIPDGVKTIGDTVFKNRKITSVTIPAGVETIGDYAFYGNNITSVTIPASVETIGMAAFSDCYKLKTVTFAENSRLTAIGASAFAFDAITSVIIPVGVETIGGSAFGRCTSLTNVTFAEGSRLKTIGENAFVATAFQAITLPEGLTTIGNFVFQDNEALQSITIPASVKTIGQKVFGWCKSLTSVKFLGCATLDAKTFASRGDTPCSLTLPANWPEEDKPGEDGYWHGSWFKLLVPVDAPEAVEGLIYNGTEQTGVAGDEGYYTVTGGRAIAAGHYTATATLTGDYIWSDGSSEAKEIVWSIAKATPTADDFTYTAPENETPASVAFVGEDGKTGMGPITLHFEKDGSGEDSTDYPTEPGSYKVAITVGEGNNYGPSAEKLSKDDWTFEIKAAVAAIGDTEYTSLQAAFDAAKSGDTVEIVKAGEYSVETLSVADGVTIDGSKADGDVIFMHTSATTSWVVGDASAHKTVKHVTFDVGEAHHQYFSNITCEYCTIKGLICTHTYNVFKHCTFINEDGYNMWAYGNDVVCEDCDFTCSGASGGAINVYNEGDQGGVVGNVTLTGCSFTANEESLKYAAVYIKPEHKFNVTFTDCTANEKFFVGTSGSRLWNMKEDREGTVVTVNGVQVYPVVTNVAAIGDTEYTSLQAAFDAAVAGETVKLLTNAEVTEQLLVRKGKTFNLDLAGFTVEYTGESLLKRGVIGIMYGGALTVQDSSSEKSGAIRSGSNAYAAISMTVPGDSNSESAVLTVKGGTLEGYYYGITGNGDRGNTKVFIQGGTVKGTDTGIYHPQSGMLVISGGTVEGATGVYAKAGSPITVSGGTVKGTGENVPFVHAGGGFNSTGDAFVVENCGYPGGAPVPSVTGGTFESTNAAPVASYFYGDNTPISGFVKGGRFHTPFNTSLVASGFTLSEEAVEGYYSVEAEEPHTHSFGRWEYSDAETHKRVCSGCHEVEYGAHNYSKPVFQWTFPTNGDVRAVYHTSCTVCGHEVLGAKAELSERSDEQYRYLTASVSIDGVTYSETKKVELGYTVSFADGMIEYNGTKYPETCIVSYGESVKLIPNTSGNYDFYLDGILSAIGAKSLTFRITGNTVATIDEHEDKVEPVVTMTTKRYIEGGKMKCSLQVDWATQSSAGITVKEAGLYYVYSTDETVYDKPEAIVSVGKVKVSSLKCLNGYYTMTSSCATTSANYNKPLYSVGYVVYTDKNGNQNTIYSDVNFCQIMQTK